jgi:hypothetical protein
MGAYLLADNVIDENLRGHVAPSNIAFITTVLLVIGISLANPCA